MVCVMSKFFFFQAEDGIRDLVRSRGLGDVYKRQSEGTASQKPNKGTGLARIVDSRLVAVHSARPGEKE